MKYSASPQAKHIIITGCIYACAVSFLYASMHPTTSSNKEWVDHLLYHSSHKIDVGIFASRCFDIDLYAYEYLYICAEMSLGVCMCVFACGMCF